MEVPLVILLYIGITLYYYSILVMLLYIDITLYYYSILVTVLYVDITLYYYSILVMLLYMDPVETPDERQNYLRVSYHQREYRESDHYTAY